MAFYCLFGFSFLSADTFNRSDLEDRKQQSWCIEAVLGNQSYRCEGKHNKMQKLPKLFV